MIPRLFFTPHGTFRGMLFQGTRRLSTKQLPIHTSDSELVREFTRLAGQPVPNQPSPMSKEQVFFLARMMIDELLELTATVAPAVESKATLQKFIHEARDLPQPSYEENSDGNVKKIADQADALVDSYYYSLNVATKHGINLSSFFQVVHEANMSKRDPKTGEFTKREDGKIIKPDGWQPPDCVGEIENQIRNGSF